MIDEHRPPRRPNELRQLKAMRDEGLITDQEYETKRRALLDRM